MVIFIIRLFWESVRGVFTGFRMILSELFRPIQVVVVQVWQIDTKKLRMPVFMTLLAVVIVGASSVLFFKLRNPGVAIEYGPYQGLGDAAADEMAQLLGKRGTVVVWTWDNSETGNKGFDLMVTQFRRSLRHGSNVELVRVERIPPAREGLTSVQYRALFDKSRLADGIVSFVGYPLLSPTELADLPKRRPKMLVVSSDLDKQYLKMLLTQNVVQAAIVPRGSPRTGGQAPVSPHEWFAMYYEVVRP